MVRRQREDGEDSTSWKEDFGLLDGAEQWWNETWELFGIADSHLSDDNTTLVYTDDDVSASRIVDGRVVRGNELPESSSNCVSESIAQVVQAEILSQETEHGNGFRPLPLQPTSSSESLVCFGMIHSIPTRLTCDLVWLRSALLETSTNEKYLARSVISQEDSLGKRA